MSVRLKASSSVLKKNIEEAIDTYVECEIARGRDYKEIYEEIKNTFSSIKLNSIFGIQYLKENIKKDKQKKE